MPTADTRPASRTTAEPDAAAPASLSAASRHGALASGGGGVLWADTVAELTRQEVDETLDLVLGRPLRRSPGMILNTEQQYGPNAASFGHAGAGGSVGFADPVRGLGIAYVMNQMQMNLNDDTRAGRLVRAVYASL